MLDFNNSEKALFSLMDIIFSREEQRFHMRYGTKYGKYLWKKKFPRGIWLLRGLTLVWTIPLNLITLWLIWQIVTLPGIPYLGSLSA